MNNYSKNTIIYIFIILLNTTNTNHIKFNYEIIHLNIISIINTNNIHRIIKKK